MDKSIKEGTPARPRTRGTRWEGMTPEQRENQLSLNARYRSSKLKQVVVYLSAKKDQDIIARLLASANINAYIKKLIRSDIKAAKKPGRAKK